MHRYNPTDVAEIKRLYTAGNTIKQVSDQTGIPFRTVHSWLIKAGVQRRPAGCKKGFKQSEEHNRKISESKKGHVVISEEQRKRISECNSCNYNGLNGYGHTKRHNRGYVLAYVPKHPNAHNDGYLMLHTVLMEQKIGRYLTKDEVVHHINHVRDDNRLENLALMTRAEHMKMHMKERHSIRRKLCSKSL